MMDVRWSERKTTRHGDGGTAPATWAVIGARVRASALLATTIQLARDQGVDISDIPLSAADATTCEGHG